MKKNQTIRLNENQFNNFVTKIVTESVKKVLKQSINEENYVGEDEAIAEYRRSRQEMIEKLIQLRELT